MALDQNTESSRLEVHKYSSLTSVANDSSTTAPKSGQGADSVERSSNASRSPARKTDMDGSIYVLNPGKESFSLTVGPPHKSHDKENYVSLDPHKTSKSGLLKPTEETPAHTISTIATTRSYDESTEDDSIDEEGTSSESSHNIVADYLELHTNSTIPPSVFVSPPTGSHPRISMSVEELDSRLGFSVDLDGLYEREPSTDSFPILDVNPREYVSDQSDERDLSQKEASDSSMSAMGERSPRLSRRDRRSVALRTALRRSQRRGSAGHQDNDTFQSSESASMLSPGSGERRTSQMVAGLGRLLSKSNLMQREPSNPDLNANESILETSVDVQNLTRDESHSRISGQSLSQSRARLPDTPGSSPDSSQLGVSDGCLSSEFATRQYNDLTRAGLPHLDEADEAASCSEDEEKDLPGSSDADRKPMASLLSAIKTCVVPMPPPSPSASNSLKANELSHGTPSKRSYRPSLRSSRAAVLPLTDTESKRRASEGSTGGVLTNLRSTIVESRSPTRVPSNSDNHSSHRTVRMSLRSNGKDGKHVKSIAATTPGAIAIDSSQRTGLELRPLELASVGDSPVPSDYSQDGDAVRNQESTRADDMESVKHREALARERELIEEIRGEAPFQDTRLPSDTGSSSRASTTRSANIDHASGMRSDNISDLLVNSSYRNSVGAVSMRSNVNSTTFRAPGHFSILADAPLPNPDFIPHETIPELEKEYNKTQLLYLGIALLIVVCIAVAVTIPLVLKQEKPETQSQLRDTTTGFYDDQPPITGVADLEEAAIRLQNISDLELLGLEGSPQQAALTWIVTEDGVSKSDYSKFMMRYIMALLYHSLGGLGWASSRGWLDPDTDICQWDFITCDESRQSIVELQIPANHNAAGVIPSELQNLPNLRRVIIADNLINGLAGSLGSELVELNLSGNSLKGSFPSSIFKMTQLEILRLNSSELEGTMPSGLVDLTNLRALFLEGNELQGQITSQLAQLSTLEIIDVSSNIFGGDFEDLSQLTNLVELNLALLGDIKGTIPAEIGRMTHLKSLLLTGTSISGTIPPSLWTLSSLVTLYLDSTSLEGLLSTDMQSLCKLEVLNLGSSLLSGTFPSELGDLTSLVELVLINTSISGTIPSEIGMLENLRSLRFDNTLIEGTVPSALGTLSNLEVLHMRYVEIEGTIPFEICELPKIERVCVESSFPNDMCGCGEYICSCLY